MPVSGVLFDLDGTLLDTAPGVYAALQAYCRELGTSAPPYAAVREVVSRGTRGVLGVLWPEGDPETLVAEHSARFLTLYAEVMGAHSQPFDGIDDLLQALDTAALPWGVVTNKPEFLTAPLLRHVGLAARAASVVAGDTLPLRKPDPAPVLHACREAGIDARRGVFVGDDARDIQAGQAAGMYTVAAGWGYLDHGDPAAWGADRVLRRPGELFGLLNLPVPA